MWRIGRILLLSALCALGPALASPARSWAADGLVDVGARGAPLHLWVDDRGQGEPVLLLHGFGANSYTWRHIAPALARTHRVISVDLKGAGRSDKPFDDAYGILDQVSLLARLIDRKGLSTLTVIAQSMGGGIALALALELNRTRPGLLKRLVYLGIGLAVLLSFIGIKLILHAAHVNELPFINGGNHILGVPDISIGQSLTVILTILTVTTVASLLKSHKDNAPIKVG